MTEIILTSSALILFLAALRQLLRGHIHPTVQYALWLLVAARLLIPGSLFAAPVSFMGAAQDLLTTAEETVLPGGTAVPTAPPPSIPAVPAVPTDTVLAGAASAAPSQPVISWPETIWRAGAVIMGGIFLLSDLTFYLHLRKRRQRVPAHQLPHPCSLRVYQVPGLASPCLFGLFRPAIYLTVSPLSDQELTHILTHEETHFRHGDHLWALLRSLCLALHWYNPLVWWAAALSRRDCELSCDAASIRRLGEDCRLQYGETLLHMVVPGRHPGQLLRTATTMSGSKRAMGERIRLIAQRPRMLKLTLAAVLLLMGGAAVFFFGGSSEAPPEEDTPPPEVEVPDSSQSSTALTKELALQRYREARELWNWFELGTLPTTNETIPSDEGTLLRVADFNSIDALRQRLEQLFSPALADYLLTGFLPLREQDGKLFVLPGGRGSSIFAGKESVTAFVYTGQDAARQGVDCHIYATTEVLDVYDITNVLYQKRHDWFMVWNGQNYIFTSFGPSDDVDPQLYDNALAVLAGYEAGDAVSQWLPSLAYLDWNAMYSACQTQYGDTEKCTELLDAISQYAAKGDLTAAEMQQILSANEGLDGAYSEQFQVIVCQLYQRNPSTFAYAALELLSGACQTRVLDYLRYKIAQQEGGSAMTEQEITALLRQTLRDGLSAAPTEVTLTRPGETAQFLPVNAYGSYAASYTSSDTSVATVDQEGVITAVSPGQATITLHCESSGAQRDFTCAVTCRWTEVLDAREQPAFSDMEAMNAITRAFFPAAWDVGSPTDIVITLSEDWTTDGICAALFDAVSQRVSGTSLEGCLWKIELSPAFQFPETMADGVTMAVPFFATYQQGAATLPSGASFTPTARSAEVTAQVTLVGAGITAPADEDFAQQQADYQLLRACVPIEGDIQVSVTQTDFDLTSHIRDTVAAQLKSAGLSARYQLTAISTGSYTIPTWAQPGFEQTVFYDITFSSTDGAGISSITIDSQVLVTTTE